MVLKPSPLQVAGWNPGRGSAGAAKRRLANGPFFISLGIPGSPLPECCYTVLLLPNLYRPDFLSTRLLAMAMGEFHIMWVVHEAVFDPDSEIRVEVHHTRAHFNICYNGDLLAASPSLLELHREDYRRLHSDEEVHRGASCEVWPRLVKPFEQFMTQLIPPRTESTGDLHSYLYPASFILEARVDETGNIQPQIREVLSRQEFWPPGDSVEAAFIKPHLSPLLDTNPKIYSSRQIQVLTHTSALLPSRVLVDGATYFFKAWSGRETGYYELQAYTKIRADDAANPPLLADVRICRLHGLVIDNPNDVLQHFDVDPNGEENHPPHSRLVGLLLTDIDSDGTLAELGPWSDRTNEDRLRWAQQIRHAVGRLHAAGVVWADAKPENVLVDMAGDAWLVDFGGSYTRGWVDEDKRETVEGGLQGLGRIEEWLVRCSVRPVDRRVERRPGGRTRSGGGRSGVM